MKTRIALDAMGGDLAPDVAVEGAVEALRDAGDQLSVALVGRQEVLRELLDGLHAQDLDIRLVDAPEVIGMDEAPAVAVKQKRGSSVHVGLGLVRQGEADVFMSAGNTGAVMAAALFSLGRIGDLPRPCIPGYFPTTSGHCIVLDVGANVDCRPEHLLQFAKMGAIFVERVLHRSNPVVALMNVGEEPGKGNEAVKAAFRLLEEDATLNFRGNIEGRDVLHHAADVVVCDGFVGNIMLKLGESLTTALKQMIAEEMQRQGLSMSDQALIAGILGAVEKRFDYQEYGGVPLLGVNGNVIIGHGGSTARAFRKMVPSGIDLVRQDIPGCTASALQA